MNNQFGSRKTYYITSSVTESKLATIAQYIERQGIGVRNSDLLGRPADREAGGLVSQRGFLPELEFRLLLH